MGTKVGIPSAVNENPARKEKENCLLDAAIIIRFCQKVPPHCAMINILHWLALCLVFVTPCHSFGFGFHILSVKTTSSNVRLQMALKDGAQEKIDNIRIELAELESSTAEPDEERIHSYRTILSCANALQEIDRDMETFQVIYILFYCSSMCL